MVEITIMLDNSLSTHKVLKHYTEGINNIISIQSILNPTSKFTLAIFNSNFRYIYRNVSIIDVPLLGMDEIRPEGFTSLYDSVISILTDIHKQNSQNRKLFIIMTDGIDNCSEQELKTVKQAVNVMKQNGVTFLFLGESEESNEEGRLIGIDTCIIYDTTPTSIKKACNAINIAIAKVCKAENGINNNLSSQNLPLDVRDITEGLSNFKL